jgi:hypothetical protein
MFAHFGAPKACEGAPKLPPGASRASIGAAACCVGRWSSLLTLHSSFILLSRSRSYYNCTISSSTVEPSLFFNHLESISYFNSYKESPQPTCQVKTPSLPPWSWTIQPPKARRTTVSCHGWRNIVPKGRKQRVSNG